MNVSMDKKYRTRGGNPVTILTVSADNPTHPVVGLVRNDTDREVPDSWSAEGKLYGQGTADCSGDLIEINETVQYVAVFKNGTGPSFNKLEDLSYAKITIEDGVITSFETIEIVGP